MEIRKDIQLLRGIAVLVVVLFHLHVPAFQNGFLGVDIFFVISGYLMATLYDKGTALDFYNRRINRLFPAYAVTILATLAAGYFLLIPVDFSQLFDQAIAGVFFASNFLYWSQNSYFDTAAFNPLLNLWSLATEVQFYLIVPFLYPVLRHRKWLFLVVFLISISLCFGIQMVSPKTSFFLMPLRIWEFLIGAWVAWYGFFKIENELYRKYAQLVLLVALVALPFIVPMIPNVKGSIVFGHPALPALLITLVTGLVICYGMPQAFVKSLAGQALNKLGDYSYSIYLVHFPLIVLVNYQPFGGTILHSGNMGAVLLICALMVVLSIFSYTLVEKKWSGTLNSRYVRFAIIVTILLAAFGLNVLNLNKYDETDRNIFGAWTDRDTYRCGKLFRVIHPTEALCPLSGINSDKRVLLIGNSHADSIKKVFSNSAENLGIATYFLVANDALMTPALDAKKVFSLAQQYQIDAIFIHYNNVYDIEKIKNEMLVLIKLSQVGGIVPIVFGPVPTYEVHVPKVMFEDAKRTFTFKTSIQLHQLKMQHYFQFAEQLKALGVATYDPAQLLCAPQGACRFADESLKPYYFDTGHLTLTGAAVLKPMFEESLGSVK